MKTNPKTLLAAVTLGTALAGTNTQAATVITPVAWYDASDASTLTTSGTSVTGWADKSGNGADLTSVGAPTLLAGAVNGMDVVDFNRSQELNVSSNIDFKWVVMVLRYTGGDTLSQALGSQTGTGGDNYTIQMRADANPDAWQNSSFMNGRDSASKSTFSGEHQSDHVVFRTVNLSNFALQVGGDRGLNNRGWDGYIAEVILGNETLTAGEKDALEGYLAHKWGFADSLVDGHDYKTFAPTDLTIVPEPGSLALLGLGGLCLMQRRRRDA